MNSPQFSQAQIAKELLSRRAARKHLADFSKQLAGVGGQIPARHHLLLIEKLEAVECGEISRLMVFMPPGSAKSTYTSILFPAWYLGRNPDRSVLAASHTTDLAEKFGRRVRNLIMEPDYRAIFTATLADDNQAAGRWSTAKGGEYYAAGVGAAILGYRADLGIIDDPVAGREQADSERERDKVWEWYKADFSTRLKPGAAVVLIMQRWHEDDLAGRILKDATRGGERWEVLSLPMEAEEDDPLGREPGELLWPEWYKDEQVDQAKRDARTWLALYQQKPRPEGGGEFRREWLQTYKSKPDKGVNKYLIVDPANSKRKHSDYTAMVVFGLAPDQNYYVLDFYRDRLNLTERIRRLVPLFEAGRVWLPERLHRTDHQGVVRDLVDDFREEEYLPFPVGVHDDLLDAMARIIDEDLDAKFPKRSINVTTPIDIQPYRAPSGLEWLGR